MWLMLQASQPTDYVVATGVGATVRDFTEAAFAHVDLDYRDHVEVDPNYFRPSEVDALIGDATKARDVLSWKPETDWRSLAQLMTDADCHDVEDQLAGRTVRVDR
jgi:GDPmannose 4,6-dehydratase